MFGRYVYSFKKYKFVLKIKGREEHFNLTNANFVLFFLTFNKN